MLDSYLFYYLNIAFFRQIGYTNPRKKNHTINTKETHPI